MSTQNIKASAYSVQSAKSKILEYNIFSRLREKNPRRSKFSWKNFKTNMKAILIKMNMGGELMFFLSIVAIYVYMYICAAIWILLGDFITGNDLTYGYYRAWKYLLDPSQHFEVFNRNIFLYAWSIPVTILGIFTMAGITGFVADRVINYMDGIRSSAGPIMNSGHYLVLGWNDKIPGFLLSCVFSENGKAKVTILSNEKKDYMDHVLNNLALSSKHRSSISATHGDPMNPNELSRVCVSSSRCVILLSDSAHPEQADADNIAKAMAVLSFPNFKGFLVADMVTLPLYKLIKSVSKNKVVPILSSKLTGRLIAQCGRQFGLSSVYQNLLDFKEMDFYYTKPKEMVGKTFLEVMHHIDNGGIVCGVFKEPLGSLYSASADNFMLNPPDDYIIQKSDKLVVLAKDSDKFSFKREAREILQPSSAKEWTGQSNKPKKILFVGWRHDIEEILENLLQFLSPGSKVIILDPKPVNERSLSTSHGGVTIVHVIGSPLNSKDIMPYILAESQITDIFVLNGRPPVSNKLQADAADNRTLVSTLMINELLIRANRVPEIQLNSNIRQTAILGDSTTHEELPNLMSEIYDPQKMEIVSDYQRERGDWLVGNQMVGMTLAQLAHSYENRFVYDELLTSRGHEIYMWDPRRYCDISEPITFFELMIRARNVSKSKVFPLGREIIIGYKRKSDISAVINPPKKCDPINFEEGDLIVTLANGVYEEKETYPVERQTMFVSP